MKKTIYTLMATLAIVSCTKEDIQDINKGNEIDFYTSVTRATETTLDNLESFYVSSAIGTVGETGTSVNDNDYFTDIEFSRKGNYYESEEKYYWPTASNSFVDFYAYAPSKENMGVDEITRNNFVGFTPATTIADQKDIIMAYARGSKSESSDGVELTFDHILSQIEIQAYNSNPGYVIKVKGVRIGKACNTGDFSYAQGQSWEVDKYKSAKNMENYQVEYAADNNDETEDVYTLTSDAISIMYSPNATDEDKTKANAMLIPQGLTPWDVEKTGEEDVPGAYLAVLVNITTASGADVFPGNGNYEWIATPLNGAWAKGYKYVYKLDLSTGGYVAPDSPNIPEDPDNPNPDHPKPGDDVLGGKIQFKTSYYSWNNMNNMEVQNN